MRLLFVLALVVGSATADAQQTGASVTISAQDQALVEQAARRGNLIYAYDQAAWHGTDDALAKAPDLGAKIGGWVVDGPAEAAEFLFFDKDAVTPHALYVARFRDNKLVAGHVLGDGEDRSISPARLKLIAALTVARETARTARIASCSNKPFNTVVLPPEAPNGLTRVYFMTPQTSNASIPMGGHHVIEVDSGGNASASTSFTKGCIDLPVDRGKTDALVISHILSPTPTEIHVFSSLAAQLPLFVATTQNKLLWPVRGVKIGAPRPLETSPVPAPAT